MTVCDRLSFAGARNGDLPTVLALISVKFYTPITSLVSQVSRRDVVTCITTHKPSIAIHLYYITESRLFDASLTSELHHGGII